MQKKKVIKSFAKLVARLDGEASGGEEKIIYQQPFEAPSFQFILQLHTFRSKLEGWREENCSADTKLEINTIFNARRELFGGKVFFSPRF
jgi:hypothetical protein